MTDTVVIPTSRRLTDGDTVLTDPPEVRQIFFVSGIQFTHDHILADHERRAAKGNFTPAEKAADLLDTRRRLFPEGLQDNIPNLFALDDGTRRQVLHFNAAQNVMYTIESVEDKAGYIAALLTPGAIVIYGGHARFGKGPCFAAADTPGDNWEQGNDPTVEGLFRMGFPFLAVPLHELVEHKYHTTGLPGTDPKPSAADSEPDLRRRLGQLIPRAVAQMHPDPIVVAVVAELLGTDPFGAETFWTFMALNQPEFGVETHVVLKAHWKDTASDPADLGVVEPQCRVFCHFGCSTFQHNFPVLRRFKKWVRRGDDRFAFWTTDAAPNTAADSFITQLLTAPGLQAGRPWEPWLTRAVQLANRDLRTRGDGFQII